MLVIVCPGQGSQTPGMLRSWLELPGVPDHLESLSQEAGLDLTTHGTTSTESTIRDTAVAQPLIVAAGLVTLAPLLARASSDITAASLLAGHSVGEITAATAAGVLDEGDAMRFVRARGEAMAEASEARPTGMSAVLGGDPNDIVASLEELGLTAANRNGAGQIVAAGTLDQLADLAETPPHHARVIPLKVAGAFHTAHMAPAQETLREVAADLSPADPLVPLVSNRDGKLVTSGSGVLERLVAQVSSPIRWDRTMRRFGKHDVTAIIEVAPGGTLVGLARRALKGVELVALKSPGDLDAAAALIAGHGGTGHGKTELAAPRSTP